MGFFEDAFISILNMSITASYVAIAVIISRLLLKKAPKVFSYALWSIVLFRLICPFSFSSSFSLLGLIHPAQTGTSPAQYIPQDIGMMAAPTVDTGVDSANTAFNSSLPAATPFASVNPMQIWITLGTLIWLIGAAVLLIYAVISYLRLKRQISIATLVSDNVYETDLIRSPFVCGFVKPKIYLPLSLAGHEREYILCHEQTHITRLDYLVKPVAFLALALHWFNPLMWLCFSLMTKDMEMSCDERVIQRTKGEEVTSYSGSLLALATHKKMPSPSPLAFGESNVKARINNILNYKKPAFWVIIASVIAVITLVVMLISNPIIGFSIYEHPETFLGANSLRAPAKVHIVDQNSGNEYMLTDANEIAQVTAIVDDMRVAKKEISKARGGKSDSRYSISYYDDINDSISEYRYTVHLAPVWTDNNVKPSFRFNLINQKDIFERLEEVFASKDGKAVYDVDFLIKNKTQYIGNHVKVGLLINGMPLPEGITRGTLELSTSKPPYGVIYHYNLNDDSIVISEEQFLRNSILLFALIDNAEEVTHLGHWNNKLLSSTPFRFTYTRADAERIVGGDVRQFAKSQESLDELIEIIQMSGKGNTKTAMKGLELYVWRKPELTGNDNIYYTLLLGTNRNKIEDEVYDLSVATTNIENINREIASYGEVDIIVSHPMYMSKEEMNEIADQIEIRNGLIAVGTGWFEKAAASTYANIGGVDGPTQIIISPDVSLKKLTEEEFQQVGTSGIDNPAIDDFRKLNISIDVQGLDNRSISFPSINQIKMLLTSNVVWFANSSSQDNQSEDYAHYHNEFVLYTRDIKDEEIRDKLKSLNIDVSYRNEQGKMVKTVYNLADTMVFTQNDQ